MGLILDIAAAILLAGGIKGFVLHWFSVAEEDRRGGEMNNIASATGYVALLFAFLFVVWRLFFRASTNLL
jgi:hypothetical protein